MIKPFFRRKALREKILLTAFLWALIIMWSMWLSDGVSLLRKDIRKVQDQLSYQQIWLNNEASIRDALDVALKVMDPKKTLSRSAFIGKVDALGRQMGVKYDVTNPTTTQGDVFNEHALTMQIREINMQNLLALNAEVQKLSPYMGLASMKITPDRRDPANLGVQLNLIALELKNVESIEQLKK